MRLPQIAQLIVGALLLIIGGLVLKSLDQDTPAVHQPAAREALPESTPTPKAASKAAVGPTWLRSGKVAVLYLDGHVDPVLDPLVLFSLGNALGLLPADWSVAFHSQSDLPATVSLRFKDYLASGRLTHVNLKKIARDGSISSPQYLRGKAWAFTDPNWWGLLNGEHILMLHPTVTLCSGSVHTIDEFIDMGLDWIGAPWKWAAPTQPFYQGGNGAFSLRRKSAVLRLLGLYNYTGNGNEDMFFIDRMVRQNKHVSNSFRLNDREVGKKFSVEEMFYDAPLGISYAIRTVPESQRNIVLSHCPEGRVLVGYLPGADWISKPRSCIAVTDAEPKPPCPWRDSFKK